MERIDVDSKKYIVLDVETNGLNSYHCDLLSMSFFKPDDGKTYERFFPLELAKEVVTTQYNGIRTEDLVDAMPLTQSEFDDLIDEFELNTRTILFYSGKNFDPIFLREYLKRKNISGYEFLHFYNFKQQIISSRYSGGNVTKDNLCKVFDILNVKKVHSGINDCRLEWDLFKKMDGHYYLVKLSNSNSDDSVYQFSTDYIIPVSFFSYYPRLKKIITDMPELHCNIKEIKRFAISSEGISKLGTNYNGLIIEHLINTMLHVNKIDSRQFLRDNLCKLKYIGKIPSKHEIVPMKFNLDGTVTAVRNQDKSTEIKINSMVDILKERLSPLIEYIRNDIFHEEEIQSQELVVNQKYNVLALCDLSTKSTVMEIKSNNESANEYKEQLFFQSNGRTCYYLSMDRQKDPMTLQVDGVVFKISLVIFGTKEGYNNVSKPVKPKKTRNAHRQVELNTQEKLQKKFDEEGADVEIITYSHSHLPILLKCKKCGTEWTRHYNSIARKIPKCPSCHPYIQKGKSSLSEETKSERALRFAEKISELSNGQITILDYSGSRNPVVAKCNICGNEWKIRPDKLKLRCYCPMCK